MFSSINGYLGKVYTTVTSQTTHASQEVLKVLTWQVNNWEEDEWYKRLPETIDITFTAKVDRSPEKVLFSQKASSKGALTTENLLNYINQIPDNYHDSLRLEFTFSYPASESLEKVSFFVNCIGQPFTNAKCHVEYGKVFRVVKFSPHVPEGYIDKEDVHYLHPLIILN